MITLRGTIGIMAVALIWLLVILLAACSGRGAGGGSSPGHSMGGASGSSKGGIYAGGEGAAWNGGPFHGSGQGKASGGKGKRKVVFASFWPDVRFAEAKTRFEALHPDIEIELHYIQTNDSRFEKDLERFVKTTNAAMLAGKGPDILEMDLLPIEHYVQQGLLVNLETLIERDATFNREQYFTNMLDNAKVGGGLYGMPLFFFQRGFAEDVDSTVGMNAASAVKQEAWAFIKFMMSDRWMRSDGIPVNKLQQ
ncbi:extracellular solute-binding protein [Paenibacillus sp. PAMC21692]|uniref:extracellular solute-binding protein n=1 Tax=Paenibacillus sp. PAMC21692 TaxID=2762320 RepID=UPI00164E1B1E|nr:extracellular solute-binding protein [Paenibacillus sp. PAMC21692]QNK57217.1 extracellular solute-binding protein [Paenibacillus sp. PAMC21692]